MRRNLMLFGAAFVAGLILSVGSVVGEGFVRVPGVGDTPSPSPSPSPEGPSGLTEFSDARTGFALQYPESWERVATADPDVRLLATPNGQDSILVRVVTLDAEVTAEDLPAIRHFTDEIVQNAEGVGLLTDDPTGIEIDGLPGLFYLYTFVDAASGQEGVHLHYFLFDGATMFSLVLQALPTEDFDALAPTFQAVVNSFEKLSS